MTKHLSSYLPATEASIGWNPWPLLVAGSLMTLASLFLPVTMPEFMSSRGATGLTHIGGDVGLWPGVVGVMGLVNPAFLWFWRVLYCGSLVTAAGTLVLAAADPRAKRSAAHSLVTVFTMTVGSVTLILIADLFVFGVAAIASDWFPPGSDMARSLLPVIITIVVVSRCLRAPLLWSHRPVRAVLLVGLGTALLLLTAILAGWFDSSESAWDGWLLMWMGLATLYWLVPLILWHRVGHSTRQDVRAQWPRIRRNLVRLYAAPVVLNAVFVILLAQGDGLYGFLLYYLGVLLLALGYVRWRARIGTSRPAVVS